MTHIATCYWVVLSTLHFLFLNSKILYFLCGFNLNQYGWMKVRTASKWGHIPSSGGFLGFLQVEAHPIIEAHD